MNQKVTDADLLTIDHPTLRTLLPHSGTMCLLERVLAWDAQTITCIAHSHRAPDNPLRIGEQLPVEAGIEYAAQAMAIHGSLCEAAIGEDGAPRIGYLAVLSHVQWQVQRLDDIAADLVVSAEKLMATPEGSSYRFTLAAGDRTLLAGEAVVALAAP